MLKGGDASCGAVKGKVVFQNTPPHTENVPQIHHRTQGMSHKYTTAHRECPTNGHRGGPGCARATPNQMSSAASLSVSGVSGVRAHIRCFRPARLCAASTAATTTTAIIGSDGPVPAGTLAPAGEGRREPSGRRRGSDQSPLPGRAGQCRVTARGRGQPDCRTVSETGHLATRRELRHLALFSIAASLRDNEQTSFWSSFLD